ncbi:MAG TPA: hypothetical protein VF183_06570 [Acidimicrobiales bacterium]
MGGSDCELLRDAWLAQPANAWSSLAFALGAVFVLVAVPWHHRAPGDRSWVLAGSAAMVLVALGSFAYHGPQPSWARAVHDGSNFALAAVLGALLVRSYRQQPAALFGVPVVSVAAIATGGAAWFSGRSDGPLCAPSSWFQWHAAWHVLAAVAATAALLRWTRPR